jgi:two-component system cell cycle sensor histidine kinase/response regulator CckA
VEDEPMVREFVRQALLRQGYSILLAATGDQALEICQSATGPFHLAILDIIMPGMSGIDLFAALRQIFPEIRVLFMSGYPEGDVFEQSGLTPDHERFIAKPFTATEISERVRKELAADREAFFG